MRIALACDHAGFTLKESVAAYLEKENHQIVDFGCFSLESVDYPDFLYPATLAVARGECHRAVLVPGAAYAGAILANKVKGIRAAACEELWATRICREHGDSNILCLSGFTLGAGLAQEMVKVFLETAYSGGKYNIRNDKIREIESQGQTVPPSGGKPLATSSLLSDPRDDALDLVTERDVENAWKEEKPLLVLRKAIITPAAVDMIESRKVLIRYID